MTDALGRNIDYLRVSITDRCNLRCRYCMPEDLSLIPHGEILRYEEILRLCGLAAGLGIRHIKVTGGEPLVRLGCTELIGRLKELAGIEHVTLTTNGLLLSGCLEDLARRGVDGVNISLDTLDPGQYRRLTGRDALDAVMEGLEGAVERGLRVKVNCVALAETGLDGLVAVASLAERWPVDVRFIELMPIGSGGKSAPIDQAALGRTLGAAWPGLRPCQRRRGFGPARYFTAPGLRGAIGLIDAVSRCFCEGCSRIRLTSEGFLKLCLCGGEGVDLRGPLRGGADDAELRKAMAGAIWSKPARHSFGTGPVQERRSMSQIGG